MDKRLADLKHVQDTGTCPRCAAYVTARNSTAPGSYFVIYICNECDFSISVRVRKKIDN